MGSLAASGGYWISTPADEIWAHPTTLTGSIGIFGMFPTFQKPMEKLLHVKVDGVGTAPGSAVRMDMALSPEIARAIQSSVDHGYKQFLSLVAESRGMTTEAVDKIAQGRIWSGTDAQERGLVDSLGTLDDAVERAAELAGLGDDFNFRFVEPKKSFKDRVLERLSAGVAAAVTEVVGDQTIGGAPYSRMIRFLHEQTRVLSKLNDPRGVYALAMIDVD
jgi:protease-4